MVECLTRDRRAAGSSLFVCVLTNVRYKTSKGIFVISPGSCPKVGLGGSGVSMGPFFLEHGHVAYQIDGND